METYKKLDENTLEVTLSQVSQQERQELEEEKQKAEQQMAKTQEWIDGINIRLAVLNEN